MWTSREINLNSRHRRKLRQARENGYLDARGAGVAGLRAVYSLWCWRLKLPLVWFERQSRYSRYGRVRLDLYTTANRLTERGRAEMRELAPGAVDISPHDAQWSHVPAGMLDEVAARVIKAAVRPGNCETAAPRMLLVERRGPAQVVEFVKPDAAQALVPASPRLVAALAYSTPHAASYHSG